ncbi:tellurite resistance TerB family protein [Roseovarius aestuarii]|uniref:Tellurite resistance protein TerB n=1 Tax=Roseovarius aestuarii TaxID=475083 RepID=A0A1X7BUV4_9RHOB|nr:TerB family tellurite resistance protein [Roseovarius aestuarii]SMC13364.1 Tellurite resistance protein TerB [Roseovarius aestuarii]
MLSRILNAFSTPTPEPLPEPDQKLALGALMVRVAKSDDHYQFEEISRIDRLLTRLFGLNPVEAAKTRAICEKLEREAPETEHFAHVIRSSTTFQARVEALEAMWEVLLADGEHHEAEETVIEATRIALGLSDSDSATARATAEGL